MAAFEILNSRHTTRKLDKKHEYERQYVVNNPTEGGGMADVIAAAPPLVTVDGKQLRIVDIDMGETDNFAWRVATVNWATKDSRKSKEATQPTETNDSEISFSIGGQTEQIQEAFAQTKYGPSAADLGNSINVQDDGSVSGIDIVVPKMTLTRVHYLPDSVVHPAYQLDLRRAVGKTNSDSFLGYESGELLLLSVVGAKRGEEDWVVTFDFSVGKNNTGLTVAGISDISKQAHDYLWVQYEQEEETTAKRMKPIGVGVYVAKVYESANFGAILKI
jgi:hypothetical protein